MNFLQKCAALSATQSRQNAIQAILNDVDDMPEQSSLDIIKAAISKTGGTWPDRESYNAFLEEVRGL